MNTCRALLFFVALLVAGCAAASASRTSALDLQRKLGQSAVASDYPEEYRSFIATIANAETFSRKGEELQAENVYKLAILKGRLLELRAKEPNPVPVRHTAYRVVVAQSEPAEEMSSAVNSMPSGNLPEPLSPDAPPPETAPPENPQSGGASDGRLPSQEALQDTPLPPVADTVQEQAPAPSPVPEQPVEAVPVLPGEELPVSDMKRFVGSRGYYTVKRGETLKRVGARLGVDWRKLAKLNSLDPRQQLRSGQIIVYDNRKIVPSSLRNGIVINIPDRTLYLFRNGGVKKAFPVALGKPSKPDEDEDWTTPTGRFIITAKTKDPVWKVPQSIQEEMERNGKEPVKEVPPGRENPLGRYALKTSLSGIMIHSTNAPSSVYSFASHGCIRVNPEHMEQLFEAVETRTPGIIVYQPVKLALNEDGKVFLEVNRDVYDRYSGDLENEVRKLVTRRKVEGKVDWKKITAVIRKKSGVPEEITLNAAESARRFPVSSPSKTVSLFRNIPPQSP